MKFHASDIKVMFIIITCIRTIIYIYIYIGRILHSSTVSVGLAQARPNYVYMYMYMYTVLDIKRVENAFFHSMYIFSVIFHAIDKQDIST